MTIFGTIMMYIIGFFSVIGSFLVMPYISRKNLSFGISIPEEYYNDVQVKEIRKKYTVNGLIISAGVFILTIILSVTIKIPDIEFLLVTPAMIVLLICFNILYLMAYGKMKALKAQSSWKEHSQEVVVVDTSFRRKKYMVSPLWFFAYLALITVTTGIGLLFYDKIPDRIPMNFGFNGSVYNWADKSYRLILFNPIVQLFLTVVFGFSYWMLGKSKQQIDASRPEASSEKNRIFRYRWSACLVFSGLGMVAMFSFMNLCIWGFVGNLKLAAYIPMVYCVLMILAFILLAITTGQSGNRIHVYMDKEEKRVSVSRDDDRYWKLGILYFNPEDPSLFIEKRFGIGWTFNWGRPMCWVLFIALMLFIAGFMVFSVKFI